MVDDVFTARHHLEITPMIVPLILIFMVGIFIAAKPSPNL